MTDKDDTPRDRFASVDGYSLLQMPVNPWKHPVAYLCDQCGAWVLDTDIHTASHADREVVTAAPTVVRLARPEDLRALADQIRAAYAMPWPGMTVAEFVASSAMHALADGLVSLAGPISTDVAHAAADTSKDPDGQP